MLDLFHLLMLTDGLGSAVMFLSDSHSDGTHSLTAEHLMKKQTHPNLTFSFFG